MPRYNKNLHGSNKKKINDAIKEIESSDRLQWDAFIQYFLQYKKEDIDKMDDDKYTEVRATCYFLSKKLGYIDKQKGYSVNNT